MSRSAVFLGDVNHVASNCMNLLEGSITLDRALDDLKGLSVGREELLFRLMNLACISISGHVRDSQGGFYPESSMKAMRGLDVINDMLEHPRLRQTVVNHLWGTLKPGDKTWLRVFCEHMTDNASFTLLMSAPKPTIKAKAMVYVATRTGEYLPDGKREAVAQIARAKGKIEALYSLTGWQCCHQVASVKSRDKLMGTDLGL